MERIKTCYECKESKSLEGGFYRHPGMTSGFLNLCKDCHKARMQKRHYKIMSTPEGIEKERERTREKHHKFYYAGKNRAQKEKHKDKYWARTQLSNAVRDKKVRPKKECEDCGHDFSLHQREAHHENYDKPFDVAWLCSLCHGKRHRRIA